MHNRRDQPLDQPDGPLCGGKVTHVTGAKAWAEAKKVGRRRHKRSHSSEPHAVPYRCPTCGLYHLGRR